MTLIFSANVRINFVLHFAMQINYTIFAKELSLHELTNKVTTSATANQWRLRYERTEEEGPLKVRQMVGRTLSCAVEKACYLEWYDAFSLILQPSHEWWSDNAELAGIIKRHTTDPWKEETDAA